MQGKKEVDRIYFLRDTEDEEGKLENLFLCDKISRIAYKTFGYVLTFDSTYKCNAYNKSLVVPFGVNNNLKTMTCGCAASSL